jgi:cytochrome P450
MTTTEQGTEGLEVGARGARRAGRLGGPKGTFVVGNLFEAWADPLALFAEATRAHGENVRLRFAYLDYLLVGDPAAVQHILVQGAKTYTKSRNYQGLKVVLGEGLLTSEGDFWKKQRKLSQPAFHREHMEGFLTEMVRSTSDMLDRWEREVALGESFDLHREMMRLTFRVVGKTLLSTDLDGEAKVVGEALGVALEWANQHVESVVRIPPWVPTPRNLRFLRAKETLDRFVMRIIEERRASGDAGEDLLGMLMSAVDADTGERMSDAQLRDEILTLVLAGHETTANALSFLFYLLSTHPDVRRRVAAEAESVLSRRAPTLADLKRLEHTTMVIEETMRLYPPAWVFERQAVADDAFGDLVVPKGTVVGISPFVIHRNPRLWDNPEGFDPERFAKSKAEARNKYAYLPFGGGPRFCIGNAFAMMEMQVIVPMVLARTRLDLVPGFRLELDPSVTLRPKRGIPMVRRPA